MKNVFLLIMAFALTLNAKAQLGIAINNKFESTIDYKIKRFSIGTALNPNREDAEMIMPSVKFDCIQQKDHELYIGCTLINFESFEAIRIPIGLNYYPFEKKAFGLNMEIYGTYGKEYEWDQPEGYNDRFFIRGSIGFTYRFGK